MRSNMQPDSVQDIQKISEKALGPQISRYIRQALQQDHPESQLISVLHKVQDRFGFLGVHHLDAVAQLLGVPTSTVTGVASFYHYFRLVQPGSYTISICMGTACYVKGADKVADRFRQELNLDFGQTSKDGLFTLVAARCLGTCGLAPVLMIGNDVHAKVTPDQAPALLDKYRQLARAAAAVDET